MEGRVIRTIPATVNRFTAVPINCTEKRKTAGYARVSTDLAEQFTSYEAQVKYYTEYIKSRADWDFVDVYTDEGITGTSTKHRNGFNQMIADAMNSKIDLIITKSVSRFARNTVDSLTTIRKLKEKGVECYFEKENIWTFDDKCELMLTIMSSIAQEEARSISENCIWGQRRRFAEGKVAVPFKSFLGYDRGKDGNLVVNEEQAKLVRRIYGMFLSGQSAYAIAKILTAEGVPTPAGKQKWYMSTIKSILTNEKYKGDALLQKTYTADFLTKQKKINNGEIPQYYVKNNHEAIIDREIFDEVQKLIGRTKSEKGRQSSISIFSSKIKCGECGSCYGSKVWHSNDKYRRVIWQCNHKFDNDRKCETPHLDEKTIKQAFISAMNKLITNKNNIIADFEIIKNEVFNTADKTAKKETIELFIRNLKKQSGTITEFDECLWMCMVDFITVNSKDDIQVTFKNGTMVKA
jgi:DNA invertase Pin-like site-specific DNA recombinase